VATNGKNSAWTIDRTSSIDLESLRKEDYRNAEAICKKQELEMSLKSKSLS